MTEKQRKAREEMKRRIGRDIAAQKAGQNKAYPERRRFNDVGVATKAVVLSRYHR